MATKEDKKPLIVPEAGNAAATDPKNVQDYAKPDNQVGAGWVGNQSATVSPSTGTTQNDGTKTLSYDQVKEFEKTGTVSGRDPNNPNVGPGGVNMKMGLSPSGTNFGVLAGAPSNVVLDHMINGERKPRTPEEQAALDKKRRRNALFAAIGDGVSALSNLYFTTKGSPSADQSNSLSKAVHDKAKEEDKEYETAMDRRIRLLKEQLAERHRQEELKLHKELNDAKVQWYGTQGKAKLQDADTNTKTKTIKAVAEQEYLKGKGESETELNKKKGKYYEDKGQEAIDKGKAAKTTAGAAATKAATDKEYKHTLAKNSTAKTNAYVSDKEDQKKKRKDNTKTGGNSYTNTKKLGL